MTFSAANENAPGLFEGQTDLGAVGKPGSCSYDPELQAYTVSGAGANSGGDHDGCHFVWKRMQGNFIVTARAGFSAGGGAAGGKLGWMVRAALEADVANVHAGVSGDGRATLQFRRSAGGPTEEARSALTAPDVIQLERQGNSYIISLAHFGDPLVALPAVDADLDEEVYVGIFVSSQNDATIEQATFHNLRVVIPAPADFTGHTLSLGSNLELLDVDSGQRQIIYSSPQAFEAPNWTPDGRALIYNSQGRLYRFDPTSRTPELIDTGFANRNNNDHVLSFDGKMIAISHHSAEDNNNAIVYTLPVAGGTPQRITAQGPSYLHGWSPDGASLVYTGSRNGQFDIYRISAQGGAETRLTSAPGLDDGPEYTPDGRYIYYNSTRTGTMQIWRMKPDGSDQEQITDDEYNNWFAHISPDGQRLIFLSYSSEVAPTAHPPYKRVYLRIMPIDGGAPRVAAYVYGGQGTINVPSWSSDSRRVAFVSNTAMPG